MPAQEKQRIAFLDGLRGIAILMVLAFHAYARWTEFYPYGTRFSAAPWAAYGWLGVHLFFLISGFVILMTLEKCAGFKDFMGRRWRRLFPAMLVCSIFIFATARFLPDRPLGLPVWRDLLPGLLFIEPSWLQRLLGSHQGLLEGAFWSLFTEMKFYLLFGGLYFALGWRKAVAILSGLFFAAWIGHHVDTLHRLWRVGEIISAPYYGWFAGGALYYRYYASRDRRSLAMAAAVTALSALSTDGGRLAALAVGLLFTLAVTREEVQGFLGSPIPLFFGFISYPLYLLHENMIVGLTARCGRAFSALPPALLPVLPFLLLALMAWGVAQWVEPPLRRLLAHRRLAKE